MRIFALNDYSLTEIRKGDTIDTETAKACLEIAQEYLNQREGAYGIQIRDNDGFMELRLTFSGQIINGDMERKLDREFNRV